jgi:hypothetical protein
MGSDNFFISALWLLSLLCSGRYATGFLCVDFWAQIAKALILCFVDFMAKRPFPASLRLTL